MAEPLRVLLPPGMGDIHWVMLKIAALRDKVQREILLYVWNADGKKRVDGYMKALAIPGVTWAGYHNAPAKQHQEIWDKLYHKPGTDMIGREECHADLLPFDVALGFNSSLEHGASIVTGVMNELATDFNYPLAEDPQDAESCWREFDLRAGQFCLFQWHNLGHYTTGFLPHFGHDSMAALMYAINHKYGVKCVMIGLGWDSALAEELATLIDSPDWLIDLTTKTTTGQLLALQRRAMGFVGFASGSGIMATHLRTPTVMLWSDRWGSRDFCNCWCPPGHVRWYAPAFVEDKPDALDLIEKVIGD